MDIEVNDKENKKIFITTKIKKHKNWTKDEDILLLEIAERFKQKSWTKVSTFFVDKNPAQCRARYKRIRPGIIKGAWAKEEDQTIIDFVTANGKNWALISKMMPTRNGKQIRDRFLNYLDPNIHRDKFTEEEDKKIIESYIEHGSKWSVIAKNFPGRTGDMIKNRFYSCLKRKIHVYEVTAPKRITKKYYKSKKFKTLRENSSNSASKLIKHRFSILNTQVKRPTQLSYNNQQTDKNENPKEDQGKIAETRVVTDSLKFFQNTGISNLNENFKFSNDLSTTGANLFQELGKSIQVNPHNNLNLEKNILNFTNALNNLLNDDQISKLKAVTSNDKENNYYSEVLSKNIENLSTFNYMALSKILLLKQQIFLDEKHQNANENLNNRQVIDYMQSLNGGNTDWIPYILNYLQSRSKGL